MRAFLALLLLAGCARSAPDAETAPAPVAPVTTAAAEAGGAEARVTAYGAAEAGAGSERVLGAPLEAVLTAVLAAPGTAVAAGQPIVTLAPGPAARIELARANTDAATATAALARARRLRADGLMSDADVESARAAAATATAQRASLGARSAGLVLRAPVAGTVSAIAAAPGEPVAAGTVVARIAARGGLRARFGVEPALLSRLRPGGPARVRDAAGAADSGTTGDGATGNGATGEGAATRIVAIDPLVDPQTRLASVYTALPSGVRAGAGEPLVASFALGGSASGVTIPYAALADDAGQPFVYVVRAGIAHRRPVVTGAAVGDRIVVERGLAAGERVVVHGVTGVEDGMKVREAPAAAPRE